MCNKQNQKIACRNNSHGIKIIRTGLYNYIRLCGETLSASNENYPNRRKVPVTYMNHPTAIGVKILYTTHYKTINFFDINSPIKKNGSKMVDAIFDNFPRDWRPAIKRLDWIT